IDATPRSSFSSVPPSTCAFTGLNWCCVSFAISCPTAVVVRAGLLGFAAIVTSGSGRPARTYAITGPSNAPSSPPRSMPSVDERPLTWLLRFAGTTPLPPTMLSATIDPDGISSTSPGPLAAPLDVVDDDFVWSSNENAPFDEVSAPANHFAEPSASSAELAAVEEPAPEPAAAVWIPDGDAYAVASALDGSVFAAAVYDASSLRLAFRFFTASRYACVSANAVQPSIFVCTSRLEPLSSCASNACSFFGFVNPTRFVFPFTDSTARSSSGPTDEVSAFASTPWLDMLERSSARSFCLIGNLFSTDSAFLIWSEPKSVSTVTNAMASAGTIPAALSEDAVPPPPPPPQPAASSATAAMPARRPLTHLILFLGRTPPHQARSELVDRLPLEHRTHALGDRQLDADSPREVAQHRRRREPLDDLADLRFRLLDGRTARDQRAGPAVAAARVEARHHQVAHAGEPGERLRSRACRLSEPRHLDEPARDQGRLRVVAEPEAVDGAGCERDHVLRGAAQLDAGHVPVHVDAEERRVDRLLQAERKRLLARGDHGRPREPLEHLLRHVRPREHRDRPAFDGRRESRARLGVEALRERQDGRSAAHVAERLAERAARNGERDEVGFVVGSVVDRFAPRDQDVVSALAQQMRERGPPRSRSDDDRAQLRPPPKVDDDGNAVEAEAV